MLKRSRISITLIVPLLLILLLATTLPAHAGGVVGNGTPGSCTEADFTTALTGGGSVTFNCGGAKTIVLTSYKQIASDTTIDGGGLITLSGNGTYLFQVFNGKTLTLQNITLADSTPNLSGMPGAIENLGTTLIVNSQLVNNRSLGNGGTIINYGTLTVTGSTLSNNRAAEAGGGLYNESGSISIVNSQFVSNIVTATAGSGGGIYNKSGSLIVQSTTFTNNRSLDGGAITIQSTASAIISTSTFISNSAGYGGAIENWGTITVANTTITRNQAGNDGGGIWNVSGQLTLNNSTVSYNTAGTTGGGISNYGNSVTLNATTFNNNTATGHGGGLYSASSGILTNVTLSGNQADIGGGMYQGNGGVTLHNTTVADNTAGFGAGIYKDGSSSGNLYMWHSLLVNNVTGNCDGAVNSLGYNLSNDHNCGLFTQMGDLQGVALPIGPLANNGGPTLTRLPLSSNPAIDRAPAASCPAADQRGVVRPQHTLCDSGAVEVTAADLIWRIYLPLIIR
jgi:predicted outer membrane repeat protein